MSIVDELQRLDDLRQSGALSESEYQEAKRKLFAQQNPSVGDRVNQTVTGIVENENSYLMLMHLSQLLGYVVPLGGLVVPILMWQLKKDASPAIDRHGRIVANWILTEIILAVVFVMLTLVVIGIPLLFALIILGIVFPIMGGLKANEGITWVYPCSFRFF